MTSEERGLRIHDYMEHMIEAARLAQSYTVGLGKADFLVDRRTQQAVVLNLITIGEIAARVMSEHAEFAGRYRTPADQAVGEFSASGRRRPRDHAPSDMRVALDRETNRQRLDQRRPLSIGGLAPSTQQAGYLAPTIRQRSRERNDT